MTLASGQGGEGEEGEKCPLVPVHQGSKCSEEGAVHGKVLKLLNQTLRICIQVQFSQRYGQIKDRRPNFFEYFCLGMTLRPEGSRNLF